MNYTENLPLVITMGEPAGIGWEITAKAWQNRFFLNRPFYLLDDIERLDKILKAKGYTTPIKRINDPRETSKVFKNALPIFHMPVSSSVKCGEPNENTAGDVISSIEVAVEHVESKLAAALVTNPIQKTILYKFGFKYPGHTEFLGFLTGLNKEPLMMLTCKGLKVVPLTVHNSLLQAISLLNKTMIVEKCKIVAKSLIEDFGINKPHLAIAGLNPHASEGGTLGTEEETIIAPAIKNLRMIGINASGPYPPDTLFSDRMRCTYNVAICMYHDQALIPIKTLDFDGGVNITLGLPIIRTSPDHGTALDIAGNGTANEKSLVSAMNIASRIFKQRGKVKA